MKLKDALTLSHVKCNAAEITNKKQVLEFIAHTVCDATNCLNYVSVVQALIKRERLGSTALGHGVAIPHARLNNLEHPVACLITLHNAINFYDDETVAIDIIFGLLAPTNANDQQLSILSGLAKQLQDKAYRNAIRNADTDNALYQAATTYTQDESIDAT